MKAAVAISLLALTGAIGCSTTSYRLGDLSMISNRNVDGLGPPLKRGVVGENCTYSGLPNLEEAIDDAHRKTAGSAIANATVYIDVHHEIIVTRSCFRVVGDAVDVGRNR